MGVVFINLKRILAAWLAALAFCLPATAGQDKLDDLLARLPEAEPSEARKLAAEIEMEWSKSGSAAMDLLLRRGRDAIEAGELDAAVEHLGALTDHAPGFAEAWHLRSVAFFKQDRYGLALADIGRALALEPRHFNVIFGLGVLLEELGRYQLAHEAFTRVEAIHPHHENVSSARERVARKLGGAEL
ncbi:tetratricopeptide repeat protein [Roseovarius sp. D22-M7]|uniref:tetratricopeptide repeat protein n=1 Tax=Roseovarius sp. D22-M7 TaxID=3127116 RepID=UPI00300FA0C0